VTGGGAPAAGRDAGAVMREELTAASADDMLALGRRLAAVLLTAVRLAAGLPDVAL